MLTGTHQAEFFERGYTRVSGAISDTHLDAVADKIWCTLAEHEIHRSRPATWRRPKPKGLQGIARNHEYDDVFGKAVQSCLDALLGAGCWNPPEHWGQLLLSLPAESSWEVPYQSWHLDLPESTKNLERPGAQLFVCLEEIVEKCGATVVAAGSHHLVTSSLLAAGLPDKGGSGALRKRISKSCDWFRQLVTAGDSEDRNNRFMGHAHREGDVQLRVDELTGKRGDLILMHPYLFHAPSPNIGPALRLALTQRIYSL